MNSYALFRLPYDNSYTMVRSDGKPLVLDSLTDIGNRSGFLIAPFAQSADCPILLIRPDQVERHLLPTPSAGTPGQEAEPLSTPDAAYTEAFDKFHSAVSEGWLQKLVLSRSKEVPVADCEARAMDFFLRACQLYPRLMVMLYSTPQSGTWLIATPEVLVEGKASAYHTIALAGTMPYTDSYANWSQKNLGEQQVVVSYIRESLETLSQDVLVDGPVTMRAGNLAHLRTDFHFHLNPDTKLGQLVAMLHPTPAVCGFPKKLAQAFIRDNEGNSRSYYSGFAGPIDIHDETHLYVSLRCARLLGQSAVLHAGGGIMPGSQCQSEWLETEYKMNTICHVFH